MKTLSFKVFLVAVVVGALGAWAFVPPVMRMVESAAIKEWTSGERVSSADLNGNFRHLHNLMVGGHGGRLVDADVNASANIASSKLAAYRDIPIAWAGSPTQCTAATCTIIHSSRITTITRAGAGSYRINITPPLTDLNFVMTVSATNGATATGRICYYVASGSTTSQLVFVCDSDFAGTRSDAAFSIIMTDDN